MSFPQPNVVSYKAGAAISRGMAVKYGADKYHVVKAAANTDRCFGIALNDAANAEDVVEVALPGGGAYALMSENAAAGKDLCAHTDGSLAIVNAAGDQIVARLLEDGVSGALAPVVVYFATASAAQ